MSHPVLGTPVHLSWCVLYFYFPCNICSSVIMALIVPMYHPHSNDAPRSNPYWFPTSNWVINVFSNAARRCLICSCVISIYIPAALYIAITAAAKNNTTLANTVVPMIHSLINLLITFISYIINITSVFGTAKLMPPSLQLHSSHKLYQPKKQEM